MAEHSEGRVGAICSIGGALLLLIGTALHPMDADPSDAVAAFTTYAADQWWVASHLTQLAGVALMDTALLILARQVETARGKAWSYVLAGSAVAGLALAAALQAVDGIALKAMVNAWAAALPAQKDMAYHAALAVRQIEVGLASMLCLVFGLTACLYGVALFALCLYPRWLSGLAVIAGTSTIIASVVMAYTGFSALTMAINMPANFLLLVWMFATGVVMWRREPSG
jgi:cytochrome c oxidase subunit IV